MNVEKRAKRVESMSDTALGAMRIREVAGPRDIDDPVKVLWDRAYRLLASQNEAWTRRRVRAIWNKEAARIEHREIAEMEAILAARIAHAEFNAETERMAAAYLRQDADFYSDQVQARRIAAGGMDRSRIAGGGK